MPRSKTLDMWGWTTHAGNRPLRTILRAALLPLAVLLLLLLNDIGHQHHHEVADGRLPFTDWIIWPGVAVISAIFLASVLRKIRVPQVLGYIMAGIVIGNFGALTGTTVFEPMKTSAFLHFLAEYGVVLLLFKIGLESNIADLMRVGVRAFTVAAIGVIAPMALGYVTLIVLLPDQGHIFYLFFAATLGATSIAITSKTFADLGKASSDEAIIVRNAAVVDDVLMLIVLTFVTSLATTGGTSEVGAVDALIIVGKAVLIFAIGILFGKQLAPTVSRLTSRLEGSVSMKAALVMSLGVLFALLAMFVGFELFIGAYAVGLALDPVDFRHFEDHELIKDLKRDIATAQARMQCPKDELSSLYSTIERHSHRHVEDLISGVLVYIEPIFFFMTGLSVNLVALGGDVEMLGIALAITAVAIIGKLVAGAGAGPGVNKKVIGWAMVPRGEVGIIFANAGLAKGVLTDELFSSAIIMVTLTTFIAPLVLARLLRHSDS